MTDKQINKFSDLTFTQFFGYDLVATFNNNSKIKELQEQLNQLKAENEELKNFHINLVGVKECEIKELLKLKQTLAEIKPILEYYANSKVGEEQPDRTYKIMLSGGYIMAYDPKPAREGLKKISEVENV